MTTADKRPLEVFPSKGSRHGLDKLDPRLDRPLMAGLCHAHSDRDAVHALYARITNDGVDIIPVGYAWLDKEKPCGERSRTILPGADWEYEIRKAV